MLLHQGLQALIIKDDQMADSTGYRVEGNQTLALLDQLVGGALQMPGGFREFMLAIAAEAGVVLALVLEAAFVVEDA